LLVAAVVVVSVVPYTAGLSLTRGLLAQGHSAPVAVATVVAAVANVALNVVLVPPFGLTGCAVATFCAYVILHAVLLSRSRVVAPTPGPGPVLLLKLGAAVLVALFVSAVPTSPGFLLLRAVLALAALGWLGRILLRLSSRRPPTGADGPAVAGPQYAMSDKRPEM
jgi:O-antigen/teichoic acid export membrane protein